jgi:hypothetical protein
MAGIDDAAKLLVLLHERVGFIEKQGRRVGLDHSENGGGGYVRGGKRTVGEEPDEAQQLRLAAALFRRRDDQQRRDPNAVDQPCEGDPQRYGYRYLRLTDDEPANGLADFTKQRRRVCLGVVPSRRKDA